MFFATTMDAFKKRKTKLMFKRCSQTNLGTKIHSRTVRQKKKKKRKVNDGYSLTQEQKTKLTHFYRHWRCCWTGQLWQTWTVAFIQHSKHVWVHSYTITTILCHTQSYPCGIRVSNLIFSTMEYACWRYHMRCSYFTESEIFINGCFI